MDCPDCKGAGYHVVPECCCHFHRDGSCCGEAIPAQEECGFCQGSGQIPDEAALDRETAREEAESEERERAEQGLRDQHASYYP